MQIENMENRYYEFLENEFGISKERFLEICEEDGEELDNLVDEFMFKECDAAEEEMQAGEYPEYGDLAGDIIDFICGPYDPEVVNEGLEGLDLDDEEDIEEE